MSKRVAVVAGDGIGPEVIPEGLRVLKQLQDAGKVDIETTKFELGSERYLATGEVLPDHVLEELRGHDAIYLGALGDPAVPPGILERGLILKIRFAFDQFVNERPVRLYVGVKSPIEGLTPERCEFVVLRENTESLYTGAGGVVHRDTPHEVATQESINTRFGVERIVRHAFVLAQQRAAGRGERGRPAKVTLVHKTNILTHAGDLWWRTFQAVGDEHGAVERDYLHVDAACLKLVTEPERFDVIVTENLFGDIITDLAAAIQGGLGMSPSGNLDPTRRNPSMFEPVHGSAPDIAGTGVADPTAAILSLAHMLGFLGFPEAAELVDTAVAWTLMNGDRPAGTSETGKRIADHVARAAAFG